MHLKFVKLENFETMSAILNDVNINDVTHPPPFSNVHADCYSGQLDANDYGGADGYWTWGLLVL